MGRPGRQRRKNYENEDAPIQHAGINNPYNGEKLLQVSFGEVDDETRRYFKSIEARCDLNEWESDEGIIHNLRFRNLAQQLTWNLNLHVYFTNRFVVFKDVQVFLTNVYEEVQGKELVLSTDAECSVALQKLLRLSSDVHLRIFLDKLSGKYVVFFHFQLSQHSGF
jgi:hypothetical protein